MKNVILKIADVILTIAFVLGCLVLIALLGRCTNDAMQQRCERSGGEFYRAVDSSNSLCRYPALHQEDRQ